MRNSEIDGKRNNRSEDVTMIKTVKALYNCIRDFFTGFAIGWENVNVREWKNLNTRNEYSRNLLMSDSEMTLRRYGYYRCDRCSEILSCEMKCPCPRKIDNHEIDNYTPKQHDDSGLTFLLGIVFGVAIFRSDEDE